MDANVEMSNREDNSTDLDRFRHDVDEMLRRVEIIEEKVNDVEHFYSTSCQKKHPKGSLAVKDKEKEKSTVGLKRPQQDASKRVAAAAKRMQELMRQLATILRQITQHRWAGPFLKPVDVEAYDDYYEVIKKPMDFSTIKNKMEVKDGTGYKNVWEVQADVRLIFKNAMKYNPEKEDVHVMAKSLLEKFEEKWLQLLPKVMEEEKRLKAENEESKLEAQLAQEVTYAQMAKYLGTELYEVDSHLEELKEMVIQKCRKMSTDDKKKLMVALTRLSAEDLSKAVGIVAQNNPSFEAATEEVDLDLDAQSESTLWKLKFFVKDALEVQKTAAHNHSNRKRAICDALTRTAKKKGKMVSS